jgi:protein-tyrosine-phosphatase/DNA-binding transcriptional ArsR family regulator
MESTNGAAPAFLRLAGHPLRWRLLRALADGGDLRVRELAGLVDQPQNLVSYHLRLLRDGDLVTTTRSTFDGRDTYYHLDVDRCAAALAGVGPALHPALTPAPPVAGWPSAAVLFVCTGNTARSPIAEALLRHYGGDRVRVASAGTRPGLRLHPNAARVLREGYGIDISGARPRGLHTLTGHRFDYVISLCDRAREAQPEFEHAPRRVHWSIPDPAAAGGADEATFPAFAGIAADVDSRIRHLLPVLASTANQ